MTSYSSKDDHRYSDEEQNHDFDDPDNSDEVGFDPQVQTNTQLFSMFNFQLVGIPKTERIKKIVSGDECKIVVTDTNKIYRWKFKKEPQFNQFELPDSANFMGVFRGKQKSLNITNIYMDQRGFHCLITTDSLNHFYFNHKDNKIRPLTKMKGLKIICLAFYGTESDTDTGEIVFASNNGVISLIRIEIREQIIETIKVQVLLIPTVSDILSIEVLRFQQHNAVGGKSLMILFSTNSSIYCITSPDDIIVIFKQFEDKSRQIKEMALSRGIYNKSQVCYSKTTKRPISYLWTNGNTLYCFKFPSPDERLSDAFLSKSEILKYAKRKDLDERKAMMIQEEPVAVGITEFHYYLLHSDCITIINKVTQLIQVVRELRGGLVLDMLYDKSTSVFWIYSSTTVWRLDASREDTEIWKILLEKKKFKEAYEVSRATKINLEYVAGLYADDLFSKKDYIGAAKLYTETTRNFEQIFNKFLIVSTHKSNEGLEVYLKIWLDKLKPEEKTQRCLLASWLIQLIVYALNIYERTAKNSQKHHLAEYERIIKNKEAQLDKILNDNLDVLDQNLVYSIMQSHGRIQNIVKFAEKKNNFQMIILHHINEENFKIAINNLKKVRDKKVSEVVYKYAHIFFREEIEETVELLIKSIQDFNPVKLIPGFMNIPPEKRSYGIELLRYSIKELKCRQKSIHNILIFFYATTVRTKEQKEELMELIKGGLHFDEDFALRLFKRHNLHEAQILVYGNMGLYRQAVNLALDNGQYPLAKQYANKPQYDDVKKKLWLQIAQRWLHQGKNVSDVINLTKESGVIKIQDLLPYFNEKIKIEDFKDEICDSLKGYSTQIDRLKKQMESYSTNAEQLKKQLHMIQNRSVEIDSNNKCEECFKLLFNEEFYIFPCMHGFHRQCLFEAIREQPTTDREKMENIEKLDSEIRNLKANLGQKKNYKKDVQSTGFSFNPFNLFGASKDKEQEQQMLNLTKEEKDIKDKKRQFDDLLAAECIYCGPSIVDTITMPFSDENLKDSWKI